MALSMIDRLTNYLMPMEEVAKTEQPVSEKNAAHGRKPVNLYVHSNQSSTVKVLIVSPAKFDDVHVYANHLKENIIVVVNLTGLDVTTQQTIKDFMNGVCYVLDCNVQRVADFVFIYAPANIDIDKQLFAYSVPTYIKPKNE